MCWTWRKQGRFSSLFVQFMLYMLVFCPMFSFFWSQTQCSRTNGHRYPVLQPTSHILWLVLLFWKCWPDRLWYSRGVAEVIPPSSTFMINECQSSSWPEVSTLLPVHHGDWPPSICKVRKMYIIHHCPRKNAIISVGGEPWWVSEDVKENHSREADDLWNMKSVSVKTRCYSSSKACDQT